MRFSNKKSFTLIETLVVIVMISWGIVWILTVLNYAFSSLDKVKKDVIAINIAREWVETVVNVRDSNWIRWAWKKEQCFLKSDPLNDFWWDWCENDIWIWSGNYILSWDYMSWIYYNKLISVTWELNMLNSISSEDANYAMCLKNSYWYNCQWWPFNSWDIAEWRFYRQIKWVWLFDKVNDRQIICDNWLDDDWFGNTCWTTSAKEFRFCSKVEYLGTSIWKIELCSVITNFK